MIYSLSKSKTNSFSICYHFLNYCTEKENEALAFDHNSALLLSNAD